MKKGFTLIELMVAISIVAIISTIAFTSFTQSQMRARDLKRKQDLHSIAVALELFYQVNRRYPCSGAGNVAWIFSSSTSWLVDSNAGTCGGSNTSIAPRYIAALPKDPLEDNTTGVGSTNRNYAYYSPDTVAGCTPGQSYALVTHLENATDPDRLQQNARSLCGTAFSTATYGNNAFILSAP